MRNHGKAMCLSRCAATAGPCITGACMSQLARARVHDGLKWHDELGNVLAHAMKKKNKAQCMRHHGVARRAARLCHAAWLEP